MLPCMSSQVTCCSFSFGAVKVSDGLACGEETIRSSLVMEGHVPKDRAELAAEKDACSNS